MRKISATCGMLMLAATAWGCADDAALLKRESVVVDRPSGESPSSTKADTLKVALKISSEGNGNVALGLAGKDILLSAKSADLYRLGDNGQLIPVSTTSVGADGLVTLDVPADGSAAGILIAQVKNIAGAVLGSAVINGLPAFAKAFLVEVPLDTLTSFKTEILLTLAKGGVPGVQNFLNVIDTFIDGALANTLVTVGAFVSDFNTIFGAIGEAIVATENVIVATLQAAGLPVDISKITNAQLAAITGIQNTVTTINGNFSSTAKNLVLALQEATSTIAGQIDQALFNAVVAGGAMFNSIMKAILPVKMGGGLTSENIDQVLFQVFKSTFNLQNLISLDNINTVFGQAAIDPKIIAALTAAGDQFLAAIQQATNMQALADAKAAFTDIILGKKPSPMGNIAEMLTNAGAGLQQGLNNVNAILDPIAKQLAAILSGGQLTDDKVAEALAQFDAGAKDAAAQLQSSLQANNAQAIAEALKMFAKVFLP